MNKTNIYSILGSILLLFLTGCYDDLVLYDEVGEGMAHISAEVTFEPLTGINTQSRSDGKLISDITSLSVIVYDSDHTNPKVYNFNQGDWTESKNEAMPNDSEGNPIGEQAEKETVRLSFNLPSIPYGTYRMYVVANMGALTKDDVADIDKLRATELEWDAENISNNKMFGYFTYSNNQDGGASGFEAPVITITNKKESQTLHSWIKRTVSKVTVDFDPSGLHQDIWIYIHDVSIRDIPQYCKLGEDNAPGDPKENSPYNNLLNAYNTPLSQIPATSKILYDKNGELPEGTMDDYQDFKNDIEESVYTQWLTLSKGSGIKGSDHSEKANALYFFENMQGDFEDSKEHTKEVLSDEIVGDCITNPDEPGYKNGVPYGTYIEVTGYYVSQNLQNTTQGKIKYRFMLGKNETYNFNSQRNHHYKLTLGFDGWANQPKWNIEYYEEEPGLEVPDQFYVSYLYNQKHMMPIKIVGNCTNLKMEIVENNWAPYDPDTQDEVPPAQVGTGDNAFLWNKTAWNTLYKQQVLTIEDLPTTNKTEFGFLALAVPINDTKTPLTKNIIEHEWSERPSSMATTSTTAQRAQYWQAQLKSYYESNGGVSEWNTGSQRVRTFTADQLQPTGGKDRNGCYYEGYNGWQINKVDDESKMFLVPIFTRNKSMINSSGFSGNNPYDSYQRKAVIRVTATFSLKTGGTQEIVKQIPVFQVRRIVNPKGVWRQASTANTTFDVTMLQIQDVSKVEILGVENQNYFTELPSEGAWKAFVDVRNNHGDNFLGLEPMGDSYQEPGVPDTIYGDTGKPIEFRLKFNGVADNLSACAVVKVLYHGNNCIHKILVRQGINEPLAVVDGGAEWSSFSLYSCSGTAATTGSPNNITAELTESPLALGSLFRRHNTLQGIRILNNDDSFEWNGSKISGKGPMDAPGNYQFVLTDGTRRQWYSDPVWNNAGNSNTYVIADIPRYTGNTTTDNTSTWGTFTSTVNGVTRNYVVPSYDDFAALNDNADYGVGVLYGDNSTEVKTTYEGAYGYQAPNNQFVGPATSNGARGMILYNKTNGNQVFFPMGKNGMGRRTQFNTRLTAAANDDPAYNGVLRYSDVSYVLSSESDYYRPVPYNMPNTPGAIYWLNTTRRSGYANSSPSAGWDMNYFIVDFGPYPDNSVDRFRDARPIKLVLK